MNNEESRSEQLVCSKCNNKIEDLSKVVCSECYDNLEYDLYYSEEEISSLRKEIDELKKKLEEIQYDADYWYSEAERLKRIIYLRR